MDTPDSSKALARGVAAAMDQARYAHESFRNGQKYYRSTCIVRPITVISIDIQEIRLVTNLAPETDINARAGFEQQHDETVRTEIERFRANINEYLAGSLT